MDKVIHVWNRSQIEAIEGPVNGVVISIWTPGDKPANLKGWDHILRVCFEDSEPDLGGECFTTEQAQAILEFVERHLDKDEWHIHCDAGFSRSVGVAIMLGDLFRRSLCLHAAGTTEHANNWVMTVIKRLQWESHFRDSDEIWELARKATAIKEKK